MHLVYFLLGSNLGDRESNIHKARLLTADRIGPLKEISSIYETEAWGGVPQGTFLNQAISVITEKDPLELLQEVKKIEKEIGRTETVRWGPREIDIDILLMDEVIYRSEKLTIPQLHLEERRFALMPLAEIAAGVIHPILKKTIGQLLEECKDDTGVKRIG